MAWVGRYRLGRPLAPETCRRLARDGTATRVLVSRPPTDPSGSGGVDPDPGVDRATDNPHPPGRAPGAAPSGHDLVAPALGGAPSRALDVGRSTRVIQPAQRSALAVRDRGGVFPGCDRPLAWCEGHHLISWLNGGPTDLSNLALLCQAHHRAVHEGGWQLTRGPDGRFRATPPQRKHRAA